MCWPPAKGSLACHRCITHRCSRQEVTPGWQCIACNLRSYPLVLERRRLTSERRLLARNEGRAGSCCPCPSLRTIRSSWGTVLKSATASASACVKSCSSIYLLCCCRGQCGQHAVAEHSGRTTYLKLPCWKGTGAQHL